MQTRTTPPRPAIVGAPASVFEGVFVDHLPDAAHLRAWGELAATLSAARRRDLFAMPSIDDTPFEAPPPPPDDPSQSAPRCVGEHDYDALDSDAPVFDLLESVRGVQERLVWLGYELAVTGRLDGDTERALGLFQEAAGLSINKFPDHDTRAALGRRTFW